jgi:hypothetical protein
MILERRAAVDELRLHGGELAIERDASEIVLVGSAAGAPPIRRSSSGSYAAPCEIA